jgi:ribosomal protein L36
MTKIQVVKRTEKTRIICDGVKRFDLILIFNHLENGNLIEILNYMFGKLILNHISDDF